MNEERAWAKIDLDAIGHNVNLVKSKVGDSVKVLGVVKANAYGHGAAEVSRYLETRLDYFAVATAEEALQLKRAGITKPVMILGAVPQASLPALIERGVMPTVFTSENALQVQNAAKKAGIIAKIHIALDTGMSRIGFQPDEIDDIVAVSKLPNIEIEGVFTHYSCADTSDKAHSLKQLEQYTRTVDELERRGVHIPIKHISNSAGIIDFQDSHFNMVRTGIITYGLYPSSDVNAAFGLKPAMSLYAKVVHVKTLGAGHGVSYGATYVTKGDTRIATLAIGYADGYPRALSNRGRVLLRGEYAPVIGRVCMDQIMVDVTRIPDVRTGDTATVVGEDGGKHIFVEELANDSASFNYEFVCGVGMRVPRVFYQNGKAVKRVCYVDNLN